MKSSLFLIGALSLVTAGITGQWFGYPAFAAYSIWFLGAGLVMLFYAGIQSTYYRSGAPWVEAVNLNK